MRQYSLSTAFSQWPYTALSELRSGALMSIIGVVTFAKEPTQTHTGGTSFPADYLRHLRYSFLRLVHLLLSIGPVCLRVVWWRPLYKHRGHKSQLFHENGTVSTKPQEGRHCPAASSQGAIRRQSLYLVFSLKMHLRLVVGMKALPVPASQIRCNGQVMTLSQKRCHSPTPT